MSPKGHFCTLSLLKRNKAASWDEPKKKKKKISPSLASIHTRALTHSLPSVLFVFWNWIRVQGEVSPIITPSSSSPNYAFGRFGGFFFFPPFVFLGRFVVCWFGFWCSVSRAPVSSLPTPETVHRTANDLPQAVGGFPSIICRRRVASSEDGRLRCRVRSPVLQMIPQPSSTKTSSSLCRMKRGHIPSLRKDAHIALFWNTTSLVPCSGVCSCDGVLRRPICSADHCLFDVAANVTFLFQSKTQQGVPSVWHRP